MKNLKALKKAVLFRIFNVIIIQHFIPQIPTVSDRYRQSLHHHLAYTTLWANAGLMLA